MIRDADAERRMREAGCSPDVIAHCRAVRDFALRYTTGRHAVTDSSLVAAGAMLHDIGRAETHGIAHAQRGADRCRAMGLPEEVARIIERHIGAGMTADECSLAGLAPRDCVPQTPEEKIVAHADNRVRGTRVISIERRLLSAGHLPRKVRKRMYRLALYVELFR